MTISLSVDDSKLRRRFLSAVKSMPEIALDAMLHGMLGLRKDYIKNLRPRFPRMANDRKGGPARKLWVASAKPAGRGDVRGRFGGRGKFGKDLLIMERGGTVRPKYSSMMAIPGRAVKDASGRVKKGFHSPQTARNRVKAGWDSVRVGSKILLFERTKSGRGGRLLFTLTPAVSFRPRLGFFSFCRSSASRKKFHSRIASTLKKGLKKAAGEK